ncbi:beta-glucanase/beta-glucan synthetase [Halobacteroides halobius DSM 5150]|uniref:Beta-glucanase/beta-glucan synthetase n=1 Tax=Halobacteroides halobius (strain ATCC 35273 / DSM 5150 / MD-1) TaxID=748449 RepID=L0K7G0_HALHC|nr:carbohydrate binding domain-containing protein [Halobacteroides halobius]AGB40279.1 beta-glucanase/beta-glucan synthetase [Halobacteroides halobius DSM 5150]
MSLKTRQVLAMVMLVSLILLSVVGCKQGGVPAGTSQLIVNVLDDESAVKTAQITILQNGKKVVSQKKKTAKFKLNNGVYKVKVSNDQYGTKSYDVYLSSNSKLDVRLAGKGNLLGNGNFNKKLSTNEPNAKGKVDTEDSWIYHLNSGGKATVSIKDGLAQVMVTNAGQNPYSVQLIQAPVKIERGAKYKVTFDAKSSPGKKIHLKIGANGNRGWTGYIESAKKLTGNWKSYEFNFTMAQETDEKARFELWFLNSGMYWLDNIRIVKVGERKMAKEGTKTEVDENKVEDWELVWSDEFNGDKINKDNWSFEVGNGHKQGIPGWGNGELQYYTDGDNAKIEDGKLVITAKEEKRSDSYGSYDYTSTRMVTNDKFNQAYGKIEFRAKLPEGQGIWPAIWALGEDIDSVGWPKCGEIDIMEYLGHKPSTVHGTVHGPVSGGAGIGSGYKLPEGKKFSEEFHTFAIEWDKDELEFYVDDTLYHVVSKDEVGDREWVYDHPYFFILNIAVGGHWPGNPDETTKFPQTMEIDYMRVYEDKNSDTITGEEKWDSEYEKEWAQAKKEEASSGITSEKVVNGTFDSEIANDTEDHRDNWYVWAGQGGKVGSLAVENGEFAIDVKDIGSKSWNVQFNQWLKLKPGVTYKITFDARAKNSRDMNVKVLHPTNYTVYGKEVKNLTSTMKTYSFEVKIPADAYEIANLSFELGAISSKSKITTVYFDNVSIEKIAE